MKTVEGVRAQARRALIPPQKLRLSKWIEANVVIPAGASATPGPVRLLPYQPEIADAIGDPAVERVTVVKPVRVGFTMMLTSALASFVANDPSSILVLQPTEADCRRFVVDEVEPLFSATAAVSDALSEDQPEGDRNTLMSRRFAGGSLKVVAAKSPRNLRAHTSRVLFIDEADAMEVTPEGSPIMLAERRTLTFADRKIVMGSTPVMEDTSHVLRAYEASDQSVYEVPCPDCGAFNEIKWQHITWDDARPETARYTCPHCGAVHDEARKAEMVFAGRWRATRPDRKTHRGFRMNSLVSLLSNASWGKLAEEFLRVKSDPTTLQTFVNTILGEGWRGSGDELSDADLAARAEDFGTDPVPEAVLALTMGVDVQHDRLEATLVGWSDTGVASVLGHYVIWGGWDEDSTWADLDALIGSQWPHALGGRIGLDAVAIDAGDGTTMKKVLAFATGRRRVFPIKGAPGNRPMIEKAQKVNKAGEKLFIVGVDTIKTTLFAKVRNPELVRFSADLPAEWYEQFASERAVVRYSAGQPKRVYERLPGRRAEALDCTVYAWAVRQMVRADWGLRRIDLAAADGRKVKPARRLSDAGGGWLGAKADNWLG